MLSNSTLKHVLSAALLFASASTFAQVTLGDADKTPKTWAEVVTFLNSNTNNLDALQDAVTNKQKALDRVEPKSETQTVGWLTTIQTAANKFLTDYNVFYNDNTNTEAGTSSTIWYKKNTNKDGETTLTISFVNPNDDTFTSANEGEFYTSIMAKENSNYKVKVENLYIYLGKTGNDYNYPANNGSYQVTSYTSAQQKNLVSIAADVLNNTLPSLKAFQTTGPTTDYTTAKTALEDAEAALLKAQNDLKAYNNLTLTGNVTATEAIANYAGTIIGNGYTFTAPVGGAVFTKFTGELSSAAVDGTFAVSSNGASFDNVAFWNGSTGTLYNGNGEATEYSNLGELAYAGRNVFGIENGKLAKATTTNKVYFITVYTSATEAPTYYVTAANGVYTDLKNNQTIAVGDNVFVKSATNDLTGVNVIYNGTASEVVITEKADFFCPEDITATKVSFDRNFVEGHNAVCLPFAISSANIDATFAKYETQDAEKFWFTITEGTIPANTPMLMTVKTAGQLSNLNNVSIKQTPEKQIVDGTGNYGTSHGLLKYANIQEILGASNAYKVYGLAQDGTFKFGGENAVFPAFRMVIGCEEVSVTTNNEVRSIAFLNGNGGSGLSGVEEVSNDADGLEVIGGNGEITINSSVDCGNVAVYTVDGKVATNANVVAGITTVNVAKGVYIVMGKKVLVK